MLRILKRITRPAELMNEYFAAAVKAFVFRGDEEAAMAASIAVQRASQRERSAMISWLKNLYVELESGRGSSRPSDPDDGALRLILARADGLAHRISVQDVAPFDAESAKRSLRAMNPAYSDALARSDPGIFYELYPDLYTDDPQS